MTPLWMQIASIIGILMMTFWTFSILRSLRRKFLFKGKDLAKRYGHGSWAVITGGAEGIGRGFANELGRRGFNLVIIDKQSELLDETASNIMKKYPKVEVKKIVSDFTHSHKEGYYDTMVGTIEHLDISLLVNNVGVLVSGKFIENDEKGLMDLMTVNMFPSMMLTKKLLPRLSGRPDRSGIITISSNEGLDIYPGFSTAYGATKAFLNNFMGSLRGEHKDKIDFLTVTPCLVSTRMTNFPSLNFHTISEDECARGSLKHLGSHNMTYGGWKHELWAPLFNKWQMGRNLMCKEFERKMKEGEMRMKEGERIDGRS